jgi:predicted molibdopterin-dependent oxidoreductase YjgC
MSSPSQAQTDKALSTVTIDGREVPYRDGQTLYEAIRGTGQNVPTLCYDPRLEAFGSCRLCVVELEGARNPVASCTTRCTPGMKVNTRTEVLEKHRKTLLEMVASENRNLKIDPTSGYSSQELGSLLNEYQAFTGRFKGKQSGHSHPTDKNPFILRDYDNCISCYRCVRVCAEQEGDYAISIAGRGFHTQITTEFGNHLKDSSCTFCGQCVQTCPTGALGDKKALRHAEPQKAEISNPDPSGIRNLESKIEKTRTICPYCGVGCSVDMLTKGGKIIGIQPAMDGPANKGALCIKGQFAYDFIQHEDRLKVPMVRKSVLDASEFRDIPQKEVMASAHTDDPFIEVEWNVALDLAARGFKRSHDHYGRHSVYGIASGRAPHEAAYTMQKFIRAGYGTHHIDNCSRA